MIDLVPVEVYAYEHETTADSFRKGRGADSGCSPGVDCELGPGTKASKPSDEAPSRLARLIHAPGLPPLPGAALAFKCFFIHGDRDLFAGRHDGAIAHWQIQHAPGFNAPPMNLLRGHAGAVFALDFSSELGRTGLLFSGSVDRTIKIWDPWSGADSRLHGSRGVKASESDRAHVQTLIGHNASVTSVKVLTHQHNGLVSCSLDRTVRTWFQTDGRALLLYPLYVPGQVITLSGESWPTALSVRTGASCSLFVADSTGCISLYVSDSHSKTAGSVGGDDQEEDAEAWHVDSSFVVPRGVSGRESEGAGAAAVSEASHFKLKRRFTHFHSLGISDLQLVADNCFVVSLGFDEKAQVIDAISGALSSTIANPSGARFTGCCWDPHGHLLLLGDTNGTVHMWSILDDKIVAKKQVAAPALGVDGDTAAAGAAALVAVKMMSLASGGSFVFTGFATGMKQWLINRDVGYADYLGHTQGIVSIVVKDQDEYDFLTVDSHEDTECFEDESDGSTSRPSATRSAMFFSASLDNTIRCWDSYERKATFGFEEQTSEITCMTSSKKFRKLFTGHDNGAIKAWGAHTGEFVQATLPSKSPVTCLDSGMVRDQEFLVVGDLGGRIWLWEVNYDNLQRVGLLRASDDSERVDEVAVILFCEAMYLSRAGEEFVVAGYASGFIRVWSVAKKTIMATFKAHTDLVTSLVMHGCFLFSGSDDLLLRMWNMIDPIDPYELGVLRPPSSPPAPLSSSSGSDSPIVSLDVIQPTGLILSAAADGTLLVWDYSSFEDERAFEAYGKIVFRAKVDERLQCLRYWPAERAVICGTADGRLLAFALPQQVRRQCSA